MGIPLSEKYEYDTQSEEDKCSDNGIAGIELRDKHPAEGGSDGCAEVG